ncbi:kinase-like protein [Auricularia subglabra TFB-10046 SS5]|nr:kinase-like protein [Auricularia subglabra TFB-10046 SS5]
MDLSMADVHALSDQNLVEKFHFLEEVGSGNWGSVWMCKRKEAPKKGVVAVKLVHRRNKTKTSAARVRSLWNEMKTVRSFKESHPAIVHFHSFIITPSYALIEMEYLPRLVPVEVREDKAKDWFRALASGVDFLHKRGVVHNDIKPANILLTPEDAPVLVDFGFAQRYEPDADGAFVSKLSYGTPEYLSPERARGVAHDTRKSDVWALGVTMFEILEGRTPFESAEGESFATKDDLERYWARTVKGRWVGTHVRLSKDVERLLRKMICPNADLRATIGAVVADDYFAVAPISPPASPIMFSDPEHDLEIAANATRLLDTLPASPSPRKPRRKDKEKANDENARPAGAATPSRKQKPVPVASASQLAQALTEQDRPSKWSAQVLAEAMPPPSPTKAPPSPTKGHARTGSGTLGNLKASLRNSLANLAKSSTWGRGGGGMNDSRVSVGRESWEEEVMQQANTSLPVVHHAIRTERIAAENQLDRMSLWIQNVEKVVADARASFANANPADPPPVVPSIPPPPVPRSTGGAHRRKVVRAHEIFARPPTPPETTEEEGEDDAPVRRRATVNNSLSVIHSANTTAGSMNRSARSRMESFENMRREMMKDMGGPSAPPMSPSPVPKSSSPEPEIEQPASPRAFNGEGPRPQPSMRLAAMMEAADAQKKGADAGTEADAALARLMREAPGAVKCVGAGLQNAPVPTKYSHTRKLSKSKSNRGSRFFTSTHKGLLHPGIAIANALDVKTKRDLCSPPDTTFASEEFAMVDKSANSSSAGGSTGRKDGTIVRRAFRALNNAVTGTVSSSRRLSRAV